MAHNAVGSLCRSSKHAGLSRTTQPNSKTSNVANSNTWLLTKTAATYSLPKADTYSKWLNPISRKSASTSPLSSKNRPTNPPKSVAVFLLAVCLRVAVDIDPKMHMATSQLRKFATSITENKNRLHQHLMQPILLLNNNRLLFHKFKRLSAICCCNIYHIHTSSKVISINLTNQIIFRCAICRNCSNHTTIN